MVFLFPSLDPNPEREMTPWIQTPFLVSWAPRGFEVEARAGVAGNSKLSRCAQSVLS